MSIALGRLCKDESGQGMVEYALVIAFISLAVMATLTGLGTQLKTFFQDFAAKLADISK